MTLLSQLRSNYRLRIGLVLILSIIWLSWLLDLRDQSGILLDQYKQTASQLARYSTQQKQTKWLTREQEAQDALAAAEALTWQNPSLGLTQAGMQDWLSQQLQQAKIAKYTVNVSEFENGLSQDKKSGKSDNSPDGLTKVRAQLEFNTDPQAMNNLLKAFSTADHQIVVESIIFRQPRTTVTVSAWHKQIDASEPPALAPATAK